MITLEEYRRALYVIQEYRKQKRSLIGVHEDDTERILEIIKAVNNYIENTHCCDRSRKKGHIEKRQYLMYWLKENTHFPFSYIGVLLGGFDHATVLNAHKKCIRIHKTETELLYAKELVDSIFGSLTKRNFNKLPNEK